MQHKTFEQFCAENNIVDPGAIEAAQLAWNYQIGMADPMAVALLKIGQVFGGRLPTDAGAAIVNWRGSTESRCAECRDTGIMISESTGQPELCGCKHVIESYTYTRSDLAANSGATGAESLGVSPDATPPSLAEPGASNPT